MKTTHHIAFWIEGDKYNHSTHKSASTARDVFGAGMMRSVDGEIHVDGITWDREKDGKLERVAQHDARVLNEKKSKRICPHCIGTKKHPKVYGGQEVCQTCDAEGFVG